MINTKEEELRGGHADNNRCKLLYKACEEEIIIQADKTRLIQVIYNLLHNAMKFTKEGTISILVEKKKDDENNNNNNKYSNNKKEVIISVKDTGSGIDSEIFPRLFSKFASKSSERYWIRFVYIKKYYQRSWRENMG